MDKEQVIKEMEFETRDLIIQLEDFLNKTSYEKDDKQDFVSGVRRALEKKDAATRKILEA